MEAEDQEPEEAQPEEAQPEEAAVRPPSEPASRKRKPRKE